MPPAKKFQREEIIDAAYELVKNEGFSSMNARRIAKELGGSVQPIYHNFSTMEELKKEVFDKIYKKYQTAMKPAADAKQPYLAIGLAYVDFAKNYPEFFKVIFMQESGMNLEEFMTADMEVIETIMTAITQKFDVSKEDLYDFHTKVWIFTHGLSCLVATKTVQLSDDEIKNFLINTVQELFRGYKERGGQK